MKMFGYIAKSGKALLLQRGRSEDIFSLSDPIYTIGIAYSEAAKYLPFCIAAAVLFRITHFPDIGIEGTFALGACSIAMISSRGGDPLLGFLLAILLGASGGFLTGILFIKFKLNSLICGIITAFVAYSSCFLLLNGSVVSFESLISTNMVAIIGLIMAAAICLFFSTRFGLLVRIAGESPELLFSLGKLLIADYFFF